MGSEMCIRDRSFAHCIRISFPRLGSFATDSQDIVDVGWHRRTSSGNDRTAAEPRSCCWAQRRSHGSQQQDADCDAHLEPKGSSAKDHRGATGVPHWVEGRSRVCGHTLQHHGSHTRPAPSLLETPRSRRVCRSMPLRSFRTARRSEFWHLSHRRHSTSCGHNKHRVSPNKTMHDVLQHTNHNKKGKYTSLVWEVADDLFPSPAACRMQYRLP